MSKRSVFLSALMAWLFWCSCCVEIRSSSLSECPVRPYKTPELPLRDMGGLTALVNSAETTRNVIVGGDLPYKFIGTQAKQAYNGSRRLNTGVFVNEWTSYTQNTLFAGGFVLFVGILLPGVAMALWTFCECCYEEDEEEEEVNRNLTWQAQVVVWSLAVAVVVVLLVLVILVGILLGANSWMARGVDRGSEVVRRTIPQLMDLKQSALRSLDAILVGRYESLTNDLCTNLLDQIPLKVNQTVSDQHSSSAEILNQDVKTILEKKRPHLLNLTLSVTKILHTFLPDLTSSLIRNLTHLQHQCTLIQVLDDNTSITPSLNSLCDNYTTDFLTLVPVPHWEEVGGVSDNGSQSLLSHLQILLTDPVFDQNPSPLPWQLFQNYLTELMLDLSWHINSTSELYFSSLGGNLSDFMEEVALFYNSTLPLRSQPRVELYLGARHLGNWEWFRSALTVTFAVLVFLGSLCLLGALVQGLYNVLAIYRYSEDSAYDHAAHQAGLFIKKLAFSISVVCILSAAFSGFFLSVAGVMGKVCGSHNNFSEILENVIDSGYTWSDQDTPRYPLAHVLLNLPEYPLKVADTLDACRSNMSLFHAFHLEQRYDLKDRIWLNPQEKRAYGEEMRNIHLFLDRANLISPVLEGQLGRLEATTMVPIQWAELTELALLSPSSLFQPDFVGLVGLRRVLEDLVSSAAESGSPSNITAAIETALDSLTDLEKQLQPSLSAVNSSASQLRNSLAALSPLSPSLSHLAASTTLNASTTSNERMALTSEDVTRRLELYINSSITDLTCHVGNCQAIAADYDSFAAALCMDVVPGMDLYWTSLLIILAVAILLMLASLLVARRFVSPKMQKSNRKNPKFYLNGAVMRQIHSTLWQLFSLGIYLWWVVHVSQNEQEFCTEGQTGCCEKCVWVFGTVFVLISVGVGGTSRLYQYFTIYMIRKCKAMKYRRFWIERKKAVNFYGQLALFFLQDLPFLILVGVYAEMAFLNVPAFYSLGVSFVGILAYLVYLCRERRNIMTYWTWLKLELGKVGLGKKTYANQEPLPSANGNVVPRRGRANLPNGYTNPVRSPYGSSGSDHSENSSQGTFQEHGFEFHPPRLSDIPEYPEGGLQAAAAMVTGPSRIVPLEPHLLHSEDRQTDSEMSEQNSQFQSRVRLDRDFEQDSDAYQQRRREAIDNFERGGVEVAPAHYYHRDMDTSTISDSIYYGSMELQGYVSSSQAPDTNSYYESSDCRDEDGDSVYSQARYHLPVPSFMGEVTVDV